MVMVEKLTPEVMLSAPRRGPAMPNAKGTRAMYSVSTHSFKEGKTVSECRVMNLSAANEGSEQLWEDDKIGEAHWIPGTDDLVLYLKSLADEGFTQVRIADASDVSKEHVLVKEIKAPVDTCKLKALDDGSIVFAVVGQVAQDGSLYNPKAVKKRSTARVFDSNEVRIWNQLYEEHRHSIWSTKLVKTEDGAWQLAGDLVNLITADDIDAPMGKSDTTQSPSSNFDVCSHGIAFSARTLKQGIRAFYESQAWYVPVHDYLKTPSAAPRQIKGGTPGAAWEGVRFSPDGKEIAVLYHDQKDWSNARLFMCTPDDLNTSDVFTDIIGQTEDDDSDPPTAFEFAGSADEIIMLIQRCARTVVSHLQLRKGAEPTPLTDSGSVTGVFPLVEDKWDRLLVSSSSFVDNSLWQIVSLDGEKSTVSSSTRFGSKYGLKWERMVEEFWFKGADGLSVQSWMIKPMDFDENKKYPWIFMPHGGPASVTADAWSTRWNYAAFAEMGYIVVLPNITGSLGFGKEFVRRIDGEWAGRAVTDLLNLLDELEDRPYLDQSRAVLAGASYSGYLVSWFFGQEVIKKFCCAIWHDGLFNIPIFELQTDLLDPDAAFSGPPFLWLNNDNLQKFNPATPERLANWKNAPPTIVIHSEKDYRCPITEGLATFNTLLAQGVPARFLTFPDECHWVLGAENAKVWNEVVFDWVAKCVRGEVKRGDKQW